MKINQLIKKQAFLLYKKIAKPLSGHHFGAFYPLRKISNWILVDLRNQDTPVLVNGQKMFLDRNDSLRLSVHSHEPEEVQLISNTVKPDDIVLDVGAHIGYFSLLLAKLVGPTGQVYAFEPHPENFLILKKNIQINNYYNVAMYNLAADDTRRMTKLYLLSSSADSGFFKRDKNKPFLEIEADRLDDVIKDKVSSVNFIKMDIEGAEPLALKGMERIINQSKNLKMLIEFYPKMLKMGGVEPRNFLQQLVNYGFKVYIIKKNRQDLATIDEIMRLYPFHRAGNLFCIKK